MENKKIAVFYGTSEGVEILNFLADFDVEIFGFVATDYAVEMKVSKKVNVSVGRKDCIQMQQLFAREKFDFVIDATHNYAVEVSKNIKEACEKTRVEYMRVDRETKIEKEYPFVKYFGSIGSVCEFLSAKSGNILLSTGSKDLPQFAKFIQKERLFPRVLPMVESLEICKNAGIKPLQIIAAQGPFSVETNLANLKSSNAKFFVSKQTGASGGFFEKVEAAKIAGVTLCVIQNEAVKGCDEKSFNTESLKEYIKGVLNCKDFAETVKTVITEENAENKTAAENCQSVETQLFERIKSIAPTNKETVLKTQRRFDSIAKPLHGLGHLEDMVSKLSGVCENLDFKKKCTIVACADNGVVAQGVTQTDSSVTAIVAANIAKGEATVAVMSQTCGCDVFPIDVGMLTAAENVPVFKTRSGTRDFTLEMAMDRDDAISAILAGMNAVRKAKASGYNMVATGEMGIGNTTTSSGICAVLLDCDVESVTGKGAGLSEAGVQRKIQAIKRGILLHNPDKTDPIDILCKIGGLDIACMCGMFLGGGESGVAVICDGFISAVSAALAKMLSANCVDYMFASHLSKEFGAKMLLEEIGITPIIHAEMALGEGTGGVAVFPLIDMAIAVLEKMPSFQDIKIDEYKPL